MSRRMYPIVCYMKLNNNKEGRDLCLVQNWREPDCPLTAQKIAHSKAQAWHSYHAAFVQAVSGLPSRPLNTLCRARIDRLVHRQLSTLTSLPAVVDGRGAGLMGEQ